LVEALARQLIFVGDCLRRGGDSKDFTLCHGYTAKLDKFLVAISSINKRLKLPETGLPLCREVVFYDLASWPMIGRFFRSSFRKKAPPSHFQFPADKLLFRSGCGSYRAKSHDGYCTYPLRRAGDVDALKKTPDNRRRTSINACSTDRK
jgi:hypothetical protein